MHRSQWLMLFLLLSLSRHPARGGENWPSWRDRAATEVARAFVRPCTGMELKGPTSVGRRNFREKDIPRPLFGISTCSSRPACPTVRHDCCSVWTVPVAPSFRQQTVLSALLESKHPLNSYATSTPATDGNSVFVSFLDVEPTQVAAPNVGEARLIHPGQIVVAAFDYAGVEVDGAPSPQHHGFASSSVLFENKVILNGDHDGDSFLIAVDKETGETAWRTPRLHEHRSYATPICREIRGQQQLVLSGSQHIAAFDPVAGNLIWHVEGPTEQFVASMVFDGRLFFAVGGYPTHHVIAIDPTGTGNVTQTRVAWHVTDARCYVPSPVVVDRYLIVADDRGTANCFDTQSGKRLWQTRMGKHYRASLVTAKGLVYFTADDGITKILRPDVSPRSSPSMNSAKTPTHLRRCPSTSCSCVANSTCSASARMNLPRHLTERSKLAMMLCGEELTSETLANATQ